MTKHEQEARALREALNGEVLYNGETGFGMLHTDADKLIIDALSAAAANGREEGLQEAAQHIETWRHCDCGKDEGRKYNTECGHAIDCDYYIAAAIRALAQPTGASDGKKKG
jgi:hypothetical protein